MAETLPCLIVGAGPTGLALAAQLSCFETQFRIVDRLLDRAHESRALAVQARTLELFDSLGLGEALVRLGNPGTRVVLHVGARQVANLTLGDTGVTDTRYPFILFVSQAETERVLAQYLTRANVSVERGVELVSFEALEEHVECLLRHPGGREERLRASYLVGCDGAHSAVRKKAGFTFEGGSYPQDFVLGDVEADGVLEPGAINSFVAAGGVAMFFPLGKPTTWRVIVMQAPAAKGHPVTQSAAAPLGPVTLEQLQALVAVPTGGSVSVRDPAWLSHFRLHHRQIAHYRQGRVFLAGDAAHIHSPVGAQGMNTGIQDAWNLGWKLALVLQGTANARLLDSYEAERWPIGRTLLTTTDRFFAAFTRVISGGRFSTWARQAVVPRLLPRLLGSAWLRSKAFGFVSELRIHYQNSPAIIEGRPRLGAGPRAGHRLFDAQLTLDGKPVSLQRAVIGPQLSLLLCGDSEAWDPSELARLVARHAGLVELHQLSSQPPLSSQPLRVRTLVADSSVLHQLGALAGAQYLIRPDGYIAFRCAGYELKPVADYLAAFVVDPAPPTARVVSSPATTSP